MSAEHKIQMNPEDPKWVADLPDPEQMVWSALSPSVSYLLAARNPEAPSFRYRYAEQPAWPLTDEIQTRSTRAHVAWKDENGRLKADLLTMSSNEVNFHPNARAIYTEYSWDPDDQGRISQIRAMTVDQWGNRSPYDGLASGCDLISTLIVPQIVPVGPGSLVIANNYFMPYKSLDGWFGATQRLDMEKQKRSTAFLVKPGVDPQAPLSALSYFLHLAFPMADSPILPCHVRGQDGEWRVNAPAVRPAKNELPWSILERSYGFDFGHHSFIEPEFKRDCSRLVIPQLGTIQFDPQAR